MGTKRPIANVMVMRLEPRTTPHEVVADLLHDLNPGPVAAQMRRELAHWALSEVRKANCVEHSNGFIKATIWSSQERRQSLRVHIWRKAFPRPKSTIHGHAWSFKSLVMFGSLRQKIFHRTGIGPVPFYRYRSGSNSDPILCGGAKLDMLEDLTINKGHLYFLDKNSLHHIESSTSSITATLVLTYDRASGDYVDVFENVNF